MVIEKRVYWLVRATDRADEKNVASTLAAQK